MGIADSQCVHEDGSTPTDPDGIRPWDQGRRPVFLERLDWTIVARRQSTRFEPVGPDVAKSRGASLTQEQRERWEHSIAQGRGT
ncbi:hypothetical protein B7P43_G04167 [Cryptotermes secundus]|uniref:Uncharacterized protein n=1 Tax=Cryptotermes secundus TaxID=105785 RepID=A0A2J7QXU5_9NEOP|nr:hypothetical protein B7P43_G04167 [Cryptotermes secundus]